MSDNTKLASTCECNAYGDQEVADLLARVESWTHWAESLVAGGDEMDDIELRERIEAAIGGGAG